MASSPTTSLTTADEFEKIAARLGSCELVRGEVVELSPGGYGHSRITANVAFLLEQWARQSKSGRVLTCEAGVVVETDPDTVRGADVAYYSYDRLPQGAEPEGFLRTPPNLVVEVIGKKQGWREMVEKAGEYLRMGVDRVWIVDPDSHRVHVFRPDAEPTALSEDQSISDSHVLPGFACRLEELFSL